MPVGWWVTVIQFGYLALRLRERWPAWGVVAALSGLGVLLPPWLFGVLIYKRPLANIVGYLTSARCCVHLLA
jgi:hypothetical protein